MTFWKLHSQRMLIFEFAQISNQLDWILNKSAEILVDFWYSAER